MKGIIKEIDYKTAFQTLPKLLTLWLEHASIVEQPIDPKRGDNE